MFLETTFPIIVEGGEQVGEGSKEAESADRWGDANFLQAEKSRVSELYSGWRDITEIIFRRNARCYANNIIATTPMFKMGCAS